MKEVPLSKGFVALVDDADYERVMQHEWYASLESRGTKWYAIRWAKKSDPERTSDQPVKIRMSRWLLGMPKWVEGGPVVDHRDSDGLNNQRGNFRVVTQSKNMSYVKGWRRKAEEPFL